jgi:NADPH2:quinone reductase
MRAAYYEKNGPVRDVLMLREVETPQPKTGEVRVRLRTSGVNPSDVKSRLGTVRKIAFPRVIPHSDGAGEIDAVGPGVAQSRVGERVWVWNAQWKRPFGTAAEFVVLPSAQAVTLPSQITVEAGACLGIPAMTAVHAVTLASAAAGRTIFISGGAGSVSHYAIQFAKQRGATVIATVSSPEKARIATDAGADHVIDYKREDVGARVKEITGGAMADAMIELDLTANAKLIPAVLHPHGTVVIYGTMPEATIPAAFCLVNSITLKFFLVYELTEGEREAAIGAIQRALEQDRLVHNVAQTFPFAEMAAAHEAVESGKVAGNVVVTIR